MTDAAGVGGLVARGDSLWFVESRKPLDQNRTTVLQAEHNGDTG